MPDKRLPQRAVKRRWLSGIAFGYLVLTYISMIYAMLLLAGTAGLIAGEPAVAVVCAVMFGLCVWSVGSLYITIPLSMYLSSNYRNSNKYARIDVVHQRALKLLQKLPLRRRLDIATTLSNLGLLRLCQGYYESAESLFTQSAQYLEENKRFAVSVSSVVAYNNLAIACIRLGKIIEAELHAEKALQLAESPKVAKRFKLVAAPPMAALASARLRLGELDSALEYFERARQVYENTPIPAGVLIDTIDQARAACYIGLATTTIRLGRQKESEQWCEKLFAAVKADAACVNTLSIEPLNLLANDYMNAKLFRRAEDLLELAYSIARDHPFHPDARQTLNYYEKLFLLTDRQSEVSDMRSWLRQVESKLLVG
jgi:tetratricopeptide (TPR) repeat protein